MRREEREGERIKGKCKEKGGRVRIREEGEWKEEVK